MKSFRQFLEEGKEEFTIHSPEPDVYYAYRGKTKVGQAATWNDLETNKFSVYKSATHPKYRRQGVMRAIYNHIETTTGKQLHPSSSLSSDGHAFWQRYRPEAVANDLRNHRDKLMGKVVHGKSGPATVTSVGSRGAMATYHHDNRTTTYLDREKLKDHLQEAVRTPERALKLASYIAKRQKRPDRFIQKHQSFDDIRHVGWSPDIEPKQQEIPVDKIKTVQKHIYLKDLKTSFRDKNPDRPIQAVQVGDDYHIQDGNHRVMRNRLLGRKTVTGLVHPGWKKSSIRDP